MVRLRRSPIRSLIDCQKPVSKKKAEKAAQKNKKAKETNVKKTRKFPKKVKDKVATKNAA